MKIKANKKLLAPKDFFYNKSSKNLAIILSELWELLPQQNSRWSIPSETMHQQQYKISQIEKELKMVSPVTDSSDSDFLAELLECVKKKNSQRGKIRYICKNTNTFQTFWIQCFTLYFAMS